MVYKSKHHIYLGDTKIATLNDSGSLYFTTSDHLGSSTLMTNASGALSELDDYYPYGAVAYENTTTDLDNWYKFTGKELDSETNLQYFGARYYDNNLGRFTSIDPAMLVLHTEDGLKKVTGHSLKHILSDPQVLNTYSYTRNNPVILVDTNGAWFKEVITGKQSWGDFQVEVGQAANQLYQDSGIWRTAMDHPVGTGVVVGVLGGTAAAGASAGLSALSIEYLGSIGTACIVGCQKYAEGANVAAPKLLNPTINITEKALNKIARVHQGAYNGTKSVFNAEEDIASLIRSTTQHSMIPQVDDKFARIVDIGRNIGVDKITGQTTSFITVITDKTNQLITAYPGIPSYLSR